MLFTSRPGGSVPQLVDAVDENSQSRFVVETLHGLRRDGVALEDIAVLFRAGFHSFDLEIELAREGIPFVKVGGLQVHGVRPHQGRAGPYAADGQSL